MDILKLIHDWLQDERNGKWFLVLDNADNVDWLLESRTIGGTIPIDTRYGISSLWEYLPQIQHGAILVTTRSIRAALTLVEVPDIIDVGPMDETNAIKLLERKLLMESDREDAAKLVAALEFSPLAVVQAAASINCRGPQYSVQRYINDFQKRDENNNTELSRTWQRSIHSIQQERLSAANILYIMSFFDSQDISSALLMNREAMGSRYSYLQKPVDNRDSEVEIAEANDTKMVGRRRASKPKVKMGCNNCK